MHRPRPSVMRSSQMSYRSRRAFTRLAKPVAAMAALVVVAGCASDSEADAGGFADDAAGGGADSVVFAEQPWVDLQVENEIAMQMLEQAGLRRPIKQDLSVELAAAALATGGPTPTSATGGRASRRSSPSTSTRGGQGGPTTCSKAPSTPRRFPDTSPSELGMLSLADLDQHADAFERKIYGIEAGLARQRDDQPGDRAGRLRTGRLGARREQHGGHARRGVPSRRGRGTDRLPRRGARTG